MDSQVTLDAVALRLSAAVEALSRLEPDDRHTLFGDLWPVMWGMRNRIAHGYLLIDEAIFRSTAERDLPQLLATVRAGVEG